MQLLVSLARIIILFLSLFLAGKKRQRAAINVSNSQGEEICYDDEEEQNNSHDEEESEDESYDEDLLPGQSK